MNIESGCVVVLSYTVTDEASGEVLESIPAEDRFAYLHGHMPMLPAFDADLEGLEAGDSFDVVLEDGYGPAVEGKPVGVPKKEFPRDWSFHRGMSFIAPGSKGQNAKLFVHEVRGSRVYVSPEHPWGGRTVRCTGSILYVRNATMEERDHGHAHGPGGHHH